jgi:hypothetical protein
MVVGAAIPFMIPSRGTTRLSSLQQDHGLVGRKV